MGVITNSGGAGAMMTKALETYGLIVPEFSQELQKRLYETLPSTASASNPIDVTFDTDFANLIMKYPTKLVKSGEVDSILAYAIFDYGELTEFIDQLGPSIGP